MAKGTSAPRKRTVKPAAKGAPPKARSTRAAAKPAPPGPPGIVLELAKNARVLPGCGFGIDQSVMIGTIGVKLPAEFDLPAIEPLLAEFALAPLDDGPAPALGGPEANLVYRIHAWHAAIQRGASVPVFGGCRLWDRGSRDGGARAIGFAVPSQGKASTVAAMEFVAEAIAALAPAGAEAEQVLPGLRKRFEAMWPVLLRHSMSGSNSGQFIAAAHRLGIERTQLLDRIWVYGQGRHRVVFNSSLTSAVPHLAVGFARDKPTCGALLRMAGLPVARSVVAEDADAAAKWAQEIGYPVVIKPADADGGDGVTAGIEDEADLRRAFAAALKFSARVMVEKHHDGSDYRVTVLQGEVIKVLVRRPGGVVGDGKHTVAELVDLLNEEPRHKRAVLRSRRAPITIGEEAQTLLDARGYTAESVIPADEFVPLLRRGNISAGGTYDLLAPEALHPDNRALAVNAALILGLDIAGVDIISGDPGQSWRETGGIVCEVNASPQIGLRDSEEIFGQILTTVLGGKGDIPVHLLVMQDGFELPAPLPELAKSAKCNAAAWGTNGWIDGAGLLGPFNSVFRASKGVLFNPGVDSVLIAMTEKEVLAFGLPAARLASIRLTGKAEWQPSPSLQQLVRGHSPRIVRQSLAVRREVAAE